VSLMRSATGTLLLPLGSLLHAQWRARIFAGNFSECRAGKLTLIERRERLAEPQQRVWRLGMVLVFLRHRNERVRGLAIVLALIHAFAKPELCVGGKAIARKLLHEVAQRFFRERVFLAQQIAVSEIILVARQR